VKELLVAFLLVNAPNCYLSLVLASAVNCNTTVLKQHCFLSILSAWSCESYKVRLAARKLAVRDWQATSLF